MFVLKAASLGIKNSSQTSIDYLGKVFGSVQTFQLRDREIAEEQCREASKMGKLSLLVEFSDIWVLYCEGVVLNPVSSQAPISSVRSNPVAAPQTPPVKMPQVQYRGSTESKTVDEVKDKAPEPEYHEIRYRGSVIRKLVNPQDGGDQSGSSSRSYRGSNY